jgi:hypothetical protein
MRFTDVRRVAAPIDQVWTALHDPMVLQRVIPGCRELAAIGADRYAATPSPWPPATSPAASSATSTVPYSDRQEVTGW